MAFFSSKKENDPVRKKPHHIGIIMDGNGRWAQKRGLPRIAGHKEGAENFKRIGDYLIDVDIEVSTFYAFSTENWKRPKEEVDNILSLLIDYLEEWLDMSKDKNMRFRFIGDRSVFSDKAIALMERVEKESSVFKNQLNLALNYGGRQEIVRAARIISEKGIKNPDENDLSEAMYTCGQPDVDLIIRTGGEYRISNFLLWQAPYAELYFTDTLWPDFSKKEVDAAIDFFNHRERRFGGVLK